MRKMNKSRHLYGVKMNDPKMIRAKFPPKDNEIETSYIKRVADAGGYSLMDCLKAYRLSM